MCRSDHVVDPRRYYWNTLEHSRSQWVWGTIPTIIGALTRAFAYVTAPSPGLSPREVRGVSEGGTDDAARPVVVGADHVGVGAEQHLDIVADSFRHERRARPVRQEHRRMMVPQVMPGRTVEVRGPGGTRACFDAIHRPTGRPSVWNVKPCSPALRLDDHPRRGRRDASGRELAVSSAAIRRRCSSVRSRTQRAVVLHSVDPLRPDSVVPPLQYTTLGTREIRAPRHASRAGNLARPLSTLGDGRAR